MKSQKIRLGVQIFFLILITLFAVNHQLGERNITFLPINPNLHSICPLGGVETLYTMITQDTLVKKVHPSSVVLMWGAIILALVLGGAFCGWICPFGTVQDFVGKIGKRIFGKRYNQLVPNKLRNYLQYLRYVVLGIILYQTAQFGKLSFESWDPYHTLFAIVSDELSIIAYVVLGVVFLAAMLEERAWCRYACPLGAINGIFNKFSIFKIRRNKEQCIDCGACDRVCPMNLQIQSKDTVTATTCTRCGKCVTACPAKTNTLEYQFTLPGTMRQFAKSTNFYVIPVVILLAFGLTIGTSMVTGYWATERAKLPRVVDGSFDPYDIRGSYSIGEVMDIFGIPKADLYEGLGLPANMCASTLLKELEKEIVRTDENGETVHFGVSDVREWVAKYIGWTGAVTVFEPAKTTPSTEVTPVQTPESAQVATAQTNEPSTNIAGDAQTPKSVQGQGQAEYVNPTEHSVNLTEPKGSTPLAQVYKWGVTQEMLEKKFNIKFADHNLTPDSMIKDLATAAGANTSEVRDYVSAQMKK